MYLIDSKCLHSQGNVPGSCPRDKLQKKELAEINLLSLQNYAMFAGWLLFTAQVFMH